MQEYNQMDGYGVYMIRNTKTGRVYIGSTTTAFKKRWSVHRSDLNKGRHCCELLQRDWSDMGESVFEFSTLLVARTKRGLRQREQQCINECRRGGMDLYNKNMAAGRAYTHKPLSVADVDRLALFYAPDPV